MSTLFEVGDSIENRYLVLSVVGAGGMGTLYRVADQAGNGAVMALKTVKLDLSITGSENRIEKFQREFQLLTQLHHPNLVQVYSYGVTEAEDLYYTMEWIEGESLESRVARLKPGEVTPIVVQICRALTYLHARQVIHGDLKPSNVLLTGEQVKIVDFGVALEARDPENWERYYTPGYTAPEIKLLKPVDYRADLYSLGAIWYTLLTGDPPLFMPDPGMERMVQVTLEERLQTQGQFPPAFSSVIARLLSPTPQARYENANQVIAAVNEIVEEEYTFETRETAGSYALRGRFVGREAEMAELRSAWSQALRVEGKLVVVSGGSGVGKTRLLEEFAVQAQLKGAWVAWGQCVEGGTAYRPWREVLRVLVRYVEEKNEPEMQRLGPVLATLLPELWLRPYMTGLVAPAELEAHAAQQRLNNVIARLLRAAAAQRPTVIIIENAHWADEATLALLSFLRRGLAPAWLLACVTYRDDQISPEHPLALLVGKRVKRIHLPSLTPELTTELVRSMLGLAELPRFLADRVQQATGGNAFFIQELIRSLVEEGEVLQRTVTGWQINRSALEHARLPDTIQQVVWQRLGQFSPKTRQVVQCAAVIGPVFWEGAVAEICRISRKHVRLALQELSAEELVVDRSISTVSGEREYLFTTPAAREVSYNAIPPEKRSAHHNRVAEWLLAHDDAQAGEHLGLIAEHLEKANRTEEALFYLRRAGEQAAAQFANAQAVAYFSRALDLTPKTDLSEQYELLLAREQIYDLEGKREAQAQDLKLLESLVGAMKDDRRRAEVALRRARYTEVTGGNYLDVIAAVETAVNLAHNIQNARLAATGYLQWGWILRLQGKYDMAWAKLQQALILAQKHSLRQVEADSLRALGVISWNQADYKQAEFYYRQALLAHHELGDRRGEGFVFNNLGIVFLDQGEYMKARAYYEQALRLHQEIGYREGEALVLNNLGSLLIRYGDYPKARSYYEQSLAVCREIGDRRMECITLGNVGFVSWYLGDAQTAFDFCRQALSMTREIGNRHTQGHILTNLGHMLADLNQAAEAADAYQQALDLRTELGELPLAIESQAGLCYTFLARGQLEQALVYANEILSYLEENGLDGMEEPFRPYLTCYRVLAAHQDPRTGSILAQAYSLLQEQAARIDDEELRRSFLEKVVVHRNLVAAWREQNE